jgi:hypothetical protein
MYMNATTGALTTQAFTKTLVASRGFYPWVIDSSVPSIQNDSSVNVTLQITVLATINTNTNTTSTTTTTITGPRVLVTTKPAWSQPSTPAPSGKALYIGLPTVAAFVILMLVGTCIWNRKHRKIDLGELVSRTRRRGYTGRRTRAAKMAGLGVGGNKGGANVPTIRLEEYHDVPDQGRREYRDNNHVDEGFRFGDAWSPNDGFKSAGSKTEARYTDRDSDDLPPVDIPRRDSDALGSLAGTPTEERHMDFHRPGRGNKPANDGGNNDHSTNLFRDELERQHRERKRF